MVDIVYHGDNLKFEYVFQSIKLSKKHLPWVRKIFILYDDTSETDIAVVNSKGASFHFIPVTSFLPKKYIASIKNSCVVESWLWRCKQISDKFIYMCDDMFIGAPCSPNDFFINEKPVVRTLPGPPNHGIYPNLEIPYAQMMMNAIAKHNIHYTRISHNAQPYAKSLMKKYYKQFKKVVDHASEHNHIRAGAKDFNILRLSSSLMVMDGSAYLRVTHDDIFCENNDVKQIKKLTQLRPKFFCVNNLFTRNTYLDVALRMLI
jgi:hypothetical protein